MSAGVSLIRVDEKPPLRGILRPLDGEVTGEVSSSDDAGARAARLAIASPVI